MALLEIEGLDTVKGLRQTGGIADHYLETLTVFYEDGMARKDKLQKCLDEGDLTLYTTHVHALKSAAANIGAQSLSESAFALEMAGLNGDMQFIDDNNKSMLSALERLINDIHSAIPALSATTGIGTEPFDQEQFTSILLRLKAAVEVLDAREIDQMVEALQQMTCTDDVKTALREISRHILLSEFDEASELIESLITNGH